MKKSKIIATIMVLAMIFAMVAGCGDVAKAIQKANQTLETVSSVAEELQSLADGIEAPGDEEWSDSEIPQEYVYEVHTSGTNVNLDELPEYWGNPYVTINDNEPFFTEEDYTTEPFEYYSPLDNFGRCGAAYANICQELMPDEERGDISKVHPSGWTSGNEPGNWNRCHLIGFQLAGENANELNLVTGTRYMNVDGMLPFENEIADYVHSTDNHVLYRVTPLYEGDELVCRGVLMEAYSVEDDGEGVQFNVFCYNVQPGVIIDYATGGSWYTD